MDKETLSNYGWIVICVLVLAVMIALATPFGSFVSQAVQNTTKGLFSTNQNALDAAGIAIPGQDFDVTDMGNTPPDPALNPDSGEEVYDGMIYIHGDYEYRYNMSYYDDLWAIEETGWSSNPSQNGWGVYYKGNDEEPGPILESINGAPITTVEYTFHMATKMTKAPAIPKTVTSMDGAFSRCYALRESPEIPHGVTSMGWTFYYSGLRTAPVIPNTVTYMVSTFEESALEVAPVIPESVTEMAQIFRGCSSLKNAPAIPSGVTDLRYAFKNCSSLKVAPDLSKATNLNNLANTFSGCTSLEVAPIIPESVTYMGSTFYNCKRLKTAPAIPENVTNIDEAFYGCEKLTGTIVIDTTKLGTKYPGTGYEKCFYGTKNAITITGNCPTLAEIAATANSGNVTVQ